MRIRTKFAIVLVILAVVLSGVVFGAQELFKRQALDRIQGNVDETANLTAEQVDASLRDRRDYVGLYASRPALADLNRTRGNLRTFMNNSRFYAALIIATNGTVVDARGVGREQRRRLVGQNFSDKPYVERGVAGEAYIAEPAYDDESSQWVVTLSAPIWGSNATERPKAVFAASTALEGGGGRKSAGFFNVISPLETETASVAVRDENGTRTLHDPHETFEKNITGTATIGSTGWQVVVTRDRSVVDDRLAGLALVQAVSILLVLAGVVSLGIWEYNTNLRQTEDLLAGFGRLRQGDYEHSLSLTAAEEWRTISDGFNDLSSDLEAREEAIREREQRLEVLNRVLRHNLKNDMSVILSWASLLPEVSDNEQVTEAGDRITTASHRLLDYGEKARQVEETMAKATEDRITLDIVPLVEETLDDLTATYPDVEATVDCPATAPVRAIGGVEYAIENVCENAFEHNDHEAPRVDVTVEQTAGGVTIAVEDNGPGIPAHEREVLQDGEETALEHGSGVGLWLVYWAVEKSGGDLEFADADPEGSVVTIELPGSEDGAQTASNDGGDSVG